MEHRKPVKIRKPSSVDNLTNQSINQENFNHRKKTLKKEAEPQLSQSNNIQKSIQKEPSDKKEED